VSLVSQLAAELAPFRRIAIDGVDGAGKTYLADALANAIDPRPARLSIDDFLNPTEIRYARGRGSPVGFFLDSHDLAAFVSAVEATEGRLIVDGIFSHRDELVALWDCSIWLDVPFEVSVPRGASRGYGDPDLNAESNVRYVEGQKLYIATCDPRSRATIVIDNTDVDAPRRIAV
jgi:uridine kinase